MKRIGPLSLVLAALVIPAVASADVTSTATQSNKDTLNGVVSAINGKYSLTVRNDRGELENVTLHQGTVILPTGLRLQPQIQVNVVGHADGNTFDADEIDAPNAPQQNETANDPVVAPVYVPNGTFQTPGGPNGTGGG